MSVCPSVRLKQLGSHCTNFREISHLSIFRKSVQNIQVSSNYDKNSSSLYAEQLTFLMSPSVLCRMRDVTDKIVEKIIISVLYSATIFRKLCHLPDNVEKYCRGGQFIECNTTHKHCMLDT
jgi:S-adenosylmethionine synthetase